MNKPIKPNITIPESFARNGIKTDFDNEKLLNGFDDLQPDVLAGDNLNKLIDDSYKGLNYTIAGIDDLYKGAVLYSSTETYSTESLVFDITGISIRLYHSIINNNIGRALTDKTAWEEVSLGNSMHIGQTIFSLLPITDAGLHLLDGTLIDGNGIYKAFVDYIKTLDLTASCFTTESEWQASVEQYGVCGKFVYDASANTVRLPKVTGILEGTIDANALGDLVEAGLPNITGTIQTDYTNQLSGAFYDKIHSVTGNGGDGSDAVAGFDASRSNPIYGNSTTVQPQTIKGYYYIVLATSTKTDIEVDIDNVVTDLNNKVDVSNMVDAGSYIAGCAMPSDKYVDLTVGAHGTEYTAPANGWFQFFGSINTGFMHFINHVNGFQSDYIRNQGSAAMTGACKIAVKKGDVVVVNYNSTITTTNFRFIYAQGSESEA